MTPSVETISEADREFYKWFRFFHDFAFDVVIQGESEPIQRRYAMLYCLMSKFPNVKKTDKMVKKLLNISGDQLKKTRIILIEKLKLFSQDWEPLDWNKRQYPSDFSSIRSAKTRSEKGQNATLQDDDLQRSMQRCSSISKSKSKSFSSVVEDFSTVGDRVEY